MSSADLEKLVEEERLAKEEIAAAEDIVEEVNSELGILDDAPNPLFNNKIFALARNPHAEEVARLFDDLENMVPYIRKCMEELLTKGKSMEALHPDHLYVIEKWLVAYHATRELMQKEQTQTSQ